MKDCECPGCPIGHQPERGLLAYLFARMAVSHCRWSVDGNIVNPQAALEDGCALAVIIGNKYRANERRSITARRNAAERKSQE